jgi:tRNA nucleotidyltransferase/poly(A) polymerase
MSAKVYQEVLSLIKQLSEEERKKLSREFLLQDIQNKGERVTREMLLEEHQQLLAARAFDHLEDVRDKYAQTDSGLSFEDIEAAIHEHSWEDELDEFYGDN